MTLLLLAAAWLALIPALAQTLRFGVIGDSGTGGSGQRRVARQMEAFHEKHPWRFVLLLGDNIYGDGNPADFERKFKSVYRQLATAGAGFHATLGNHDRLHPRSRRGLAQVEDPAFGFVGRQDEYVLEYGNLARFICLNSDAWLEEIAAPGRLEVRLARLRSWLSQSGRFRWNFAFFHHPLYSFVQREIWFFTMPRGHGPELELRGVLEPELVGKLDVVLTGHEHFYQKIRPQQGVHYFISGGGGKVRKGVRRDHPEVEFGAETLHFLDFELSERELKYAAISDQGVRLHGGVISK